MKSTNGWQDYKYTTMRIKWQDHINAVILIVISLVIGSASFANR